MAKNKINFRGEVNEMTASYFIGELNRLPARSSCTVYLHTPGGDIYAGGEMINALREAIERGISVDIELGSLVASMGAAFLASAKAQGCFVSAHPNTEVMFHGCWTIMLGGADEMTDQAKAMRDFNDTVKADLKKCGITDTDEWFAADRQKWLNASELKELGLVDEVIGESAKDEDFKNDAVKIAASLNKKESPKMEETNTQEAEQQTETAETVVETPVETPAEPKTEEQPAPVETVAPTAEEIEQRVADLANKRFAGLQAKHDKMISDLTNERDTLAKDLAAANAVVTSLQADVEKLEHDLADLRDQLSKSESNRASIVSAALKPSEELPTMNEGLAKCNTLAEKIEFIKSGKFKSN